MTRLDGAATAFGGGSGRLLSSARSMSHLAGGCGGGGGRSVVLGANKDRSTHHRSMIALNPVPPPRPTRAERLRKRAREFANGGGAGTWKIYTHQSYTLSLYCYGSCVMYTTYCGN